MKNYRTLLASLLLFSSVTVMADSGVFIGVVYDFGGTNVKSGFGFSAKLVSNDETDKGIYALGLSYFPQSANKLGADVSVGYTFDNSLLTVGYDIFNRKPQMGLGYMDTDNGKKDAPVSMPPPPTAGEGEGEGEGGGEGDA